MKKQWISGLIIILSLIAGCSTVPKTAESRAVQSAQVREAISIFKTKDPSIERFFERSYGYAVLPKIFKGGFWIGGAHGKGEVFERNRMVGYCNMSQATLGFTFGGEYFREIIFFRDKEDLDKLASTEHLRKSIFLFHTPPYQTNLDRAALDNKMIDHVPLDVHVGSIAVRRFIENRQPYITLHGHVHESARITGSWKERIGETYLFSAAHDGPELAIVQFDLDDPGNATRKLL